MIQPLVENAIKYTLAFSEVSVGHILADIYSQEDRTIIDVTDDGQGLNAAKDNKEPGHESLHLVISKSGWNNYHRYIGKYIRWTLQR